MMTFRIIAGAAILVCTVMLSVGTEILSARDLPLSVRNSFRVGTTGVPCSAQNSPLDERLEGIFDRAYALSCRDALGQIGTVLAVRRDVEINAAPTLLGSSLKCGTVEDVAIENIGNVRKLTCHDESGLDYRRYLVREGGLSYFVEGLAGYDPALRLAFASVVQDRPVEGEIRVATTEISDAAAFARVQAGQLNEADLRNEAYLRNNGGRYAEAAEFFQSIATESGVVGNRQAEALANQGLQLSNLGDFNASLRLFDQAESLLASSDAVGQRLLRNYRALDYLNQDYPDDALIILDQPMLPITNESVAEELRQGIIDDSMAIRINRESTDYQKLGGVDPGLTPQELAIALDAQGSAIRGSALRQTGDLLAADRSLAEAVEVLRAIREGHLHSASFMIAEIQIERAQIAEELGRLDMSGAAYDAAIRVAADSFPRSPILLATEARKAAFLARNGATRASRQLFADVVGQSSLVDGSGPTVRELLRPYFDILSDAGNGQSASDMFDASQALERPGLAQTQAVLARRFSEGNDEAAALFRLATVRSRDIARTQAEIVKLSTLVEPTVAQTSRLQFSQDALDALQREQTEIIARLAEFPRYRAIAPTRVELANLQQTLGDAEAYAKMMVVGDSVYMLFITSNDAIAYRPGINTEDLEFKAQLLRDSVVQSVGGQTLVNVFDVEGSYDLYRDLFGPVHDRLTATNHLIFEPDGGMLQVPPGILVTDEAGVRAYIDRQSQDDADPFDFTGIDWLGRDRQISIAVSPRGFIELRNLAPSQAKRDYLGLGQNAIPSQQHISASASDPCAWPVSTWGNPISSDELYFAASRFSTGDVITDDRFTDTALLGSDDLDEYRVVHFATHGLVTASKPGCPPRPALVTSFGENESDGLLSFREIFDLNLNADVVILSACDTAGMATAAVSREAGVTTGGNFALDGLVRAFVAAGARSVVASHWPVPDDFDATERLVNAIVGAEPGTTLAQSLVNGQEDLMDDAQTSHPFYWGAFIILGDGQKQLIAAGG